MCAGFVPRGHGSLRPYRLWNVRPWFRIAGDRGQLRLHGSEEEDADHGGRIPFEVGIGVRKVQVNVRVRCGQVIVFESAVVRGLVYMQQAALDARREHG